jgi:pyruvate dehydrogenase (quinone)
VCISTSGPGAVHMLNGLYDAKLDHAPVLALVGQQSRAALGSGYLQEIDLPAVFKDVAHEYVQMATTPAQVRHLLDRAVRIALAERTPTCLILPTDVQELEAVPEPPHKHYMAHSGVGFSRPRVLPEDGDLRRAAEVLNAGEKVAILVGQGALGASAEVAEVADVLGAGVAKALLGKPVLADDLPFVTGGIGLLGTKPSWDLMMGCDTLLMIGSGFPYAEFLPEEGQARGVQIDIDGRALGVRYPMEVNLTGDSAETLRALLPLLTRKDDRSWRDGIETGVAKWWQTLEARAMADADPLNPQRVFWELSPRLPEDCILAVDSGSSANWFARDLKIRPGMLASVSSTLASMGCALPYAIAAKFAYPDRPVIAMAGDGAMQMNGLSELITVAHYRQRWANQRLIVLVLNNRDLNQVSWEQRAMVGDPKFSASQDLPDFPYARYAELIGLRGIRVDSPEAVGPAWDEALAADRPVVLEAVTDPNVPPLPPHITVENARALASALRGGDPDARAVIKESVRQKLANIFNSG